MQSYNSVQQSHVYTFDYIFDSVKNMLKRQTLDGIVIF